MTPDHIAAIRADARRAADMFAAHPLDGDEDRGVVELAALLGSLAGNAENLCDEVERLERVQVAIMDRLALMTEKFGIEVEAGVRLAAERDNVQARVADLERELADADRLQAERDRVSDGLADSHARLTTRIAELEAALRLIREMALDPCRDFTGMIAEQAEKLLPKA